MKDIMVSIRIPESLLNELKESSKKKHYMDVSEEVRTIVRDRWQEAKNPELMELKKLKESIKHELQKKKQKLLTLELVKELESIKSDIKKEGLSE